MKPLQLFSYVVLFFSSLVLTSCEPDEVKDGKGDLTIRFKLVYGDVPLEMFKTYAYPLTNDPFFMTRLSFFISDLALKSSEKEVLLKDIDYLNLTTTYTGGTPLNGFEYKLNGVPAGQYSTLKFGIGVPMASNALQPKDFPAGSILSNTSEYWSSWKSYIFFRPEGKIKLSGSNAFDTDFALHLGADAAYRIVDLSKSVTITSGNNSNVDVTIDIQKFFNGKTFHDINETPQIHSLFQIPLINSLADNLTTAIK